MAAPPESPDAHPEAALEEKGADAALSDDQKPPSN